MNTYLNKNRGSGTVSVLSNIPGLDIKDEIVDSYSDSVAMGVCNYALFQRYSSFRWPAWICHPLAGSHSGQPVIPPPLLVNTVMRDTLPCPVIPGREDVCIDPSGMLYTGSAGWSIEIWVYAAGRIYTPGENLKGIIQNVEPENGIIHSRWKDRLFTLDLSLYSGSAPVRGAILEVNTALPARSAGICLMFVLRPYDGRRIGGAREIDYSADSGQLKVNGETQVSVASVPDFLLTGSADCGDISYDGIDNDNDGSSAGIKCGKGLATMALCYELKKGGHTRFFRIAQGEGGLPDNSPEICIKARENLKLNYVSAVPQGVEINISDERIMNWFRGVKNSLAHVNDRDFFNTRGSIDEPDYQSVYHIVSAFCMVGFEDMALKMINRFLDGFAIDRKKPSLKSSIDLCYLLITVSEYYTKTRDADFIQSGYGKIRDLSRVLLKKTASIKDGLNEGFNSIRQYAAKQGHAYDILLMAFALEQVSLCSRSMGIFGEEVRLRRESERLASLFSGLAGEICNDPDLPLNDFSLFFIYAGFPFRLSGLDENITSALTGRIRSHFREPLLFVKSLGSDIASSLVMANNLILEKDQGAYEIIDALLKIGDGRYHLPEYTDPETGMGCWGRGHSRSISSLLFATIRNLFFVDMPERLILFPVPRDEWFTPGSEIILRNALSRFGPISIRVLSTANEIQFHFEELPRFVPPDILINLPVRAKIHRADDFLVKNTEKQSYLINGWPSVVRFIRK